MNRSVVREKGRFEPRFGDGRMRVDCVDDAGDGKFIRDRERHLGDER